MTSDIWHAGLIGVSPALARLRQSAEQLDAPIRFMGPELGVPVAEEAGCKFNISKYDRDGLIAMQ